MWTTVDKRIRRYLALNIQKCLSYIFLFIISLMIKNVTTDKCKFILKNEFNYTTLTITTISIVPFENILYF